MHQGIKALIEKKKKNRTLHNKTNSFQAISVTSLYTPSNTASKSTKSILLKLKREFNTFLSGTYKLSV